MIPQSMDGPLRLPLPTDPLEVGTWLETSSERVIVALNLVPIAGVAFMWLAPRGRPMRRLRVAG